MNVEALQKDIIGSEGFPGVLYDDATGKPLKKGDTIIGTPTIAIGRNATRSLSFDEAQYLLLNDICASEAAAKKLFLNFDRYTDERQRAITELLFAMGEPIFLDFKNMIAAIRFENWERASVELLDSDWARQVKYSRASRLAKMLYGNGTKKE